MTQLRTGCLPRAHSPCIPHLSSLLAGVQLPTPPRELDNTEHLPDDLGMFLNNELGDCAEAGFFHGVQVWSQVAQGSELTVPDNTVRQLYQDGAGYVPGQPDTDRGTVLQELLTYLMQTGALMPDGTRHKILGFIEVDPTNQTHLDIVTAEFGAVYLGFNVPTYLMQLLTAPGSVWDVPGSSGIPSDADQTSDGGHCVLSASYRADRSRGIASWGSKDYRMTQPFWARRVDECYAIFDPLWREKTGKTPLGLTDAEIDGLMAALREQQSARALQLPTIASHRQLSWDIGINIQFHF